MATLKIRNESNDGWYEFGAERPLGPMGPTGGPGAIGVMSETGATGAIGDISGWTLSASRTHLYLDNFSVSGDISGWTLPVSLVVLSLYNTSVSGCPSLASAVALKELSYQDCALPEATVDAILLAIYNRRASFTDASPTANLGGTNDNPSGVYQDATPPTTGMEHKYKLEMDPDAEGFNKWAITT